MSLNGELLERYACCETAADVIAAQNAFLAEGGVGAHSSGEPGLGWVGLGCES